MFRRREHNPGLVPGRIIDDDSLPSVDPERYGAFETRNGETVLYDSDAKGAWIRADNAVDLRR